MATINHRHHSEMPNGGYDIDVDEWNDSLVITGGTDGQVLARDSAAPDGWSFQTPPSPDLGSATGMLPQSQVINLTADLAAKAPLGAAPTAHHGSHETGGSDAIAALSAGVLTSGTIANARLSADVALTSSLSIGTTPAQTGAIRLANSTGAINARNAAGTADINLIYANSANAVVISSGSTLTKVIGTLEVGSNYGTPAASGFIRMPSGSNFRFRNAANTADLTVFACNTDDTVSLASSTCVAVKPGGNNQLDFGATANMWKSAYFGTAVSIGTVPALSGALRLANNQGIYARNAANTADVLILRLNAADQIEPGGSGGGGTLPTDHIALTDYLAIGTNPTQTGAIRLANTGAIMWRDSTNQYDKAGITLDANNSLVLGGGAAQIIAGSPLTASPDNAVDLGYSWGLRFRNGYFGTSLSIGTNPAQSGAIRLGNGQVLYSRNASNTGDIAGVFVYSDNKVYVGDFSNDAGLVLRSAVGVAVVPTLSVGSNPAFSGIICLPNNTEIKARNAANTADITLLRMFADNNIYVGQAGTNFMPNSNGSQDISAPGQKWRDAYLAGTIDSGAYKVGGVAGASKAAGPVTSITVVNGIVTAIS